MSQENVEIVRRVFEAVGRHDTEAVLSAYDPNVEVDFSGGPLASLMGDTVYRGYDGLRKMVRDRYVDFERVEDDCQELIDAGQRVISLVITRGRGRSSGIDSEIRQYGCGRSGTTRSSALIGSTATQKPSKPPGCRSRRCLIASTPPPG